MSKSIYLFVIISFLFSCTKKTDNTTTNTISETVTEDLYTVLTPQETGIIFKNELKETTYMNGLMYEYFYNGAGVAVADFNNDGLMDIYFLNNLKPNSLYINQGNMKFKDVTYTSKTKGKYGYVTGVTVTDINNDGLMDIYICKSGRIKNPEKRKNELLVNQGNDVNGNPVFKEESGKYGLDLTTFSTQASFFDYDKDGDLDMFIINHGVAMYDRNKISQLMNLRAENRAERLYRNDHGNFTDVSKEAGLMNNMLGYGLGLAIGDVNNDGWPDVYVSNDFSGRDHFYLNKKNGTFQEMSLETFKHISFYSMGNDMADFNNDGLIDIMTLDMMAEDNFTQKTSMSGMNPDAFNEHVDLGLHHQYMYNALQMNMGTDQNGIPKFSDIAQMAGVPSTDWSWSPLFFDMNNDGFKDLLVTNGIKRDFRNNDFIIYRKKKQEEVKKNKVIKTDEYIADLLSKMPDRKKKNYFFLNNKDLQFQKFNVDQIKSCSNGAAYADFDNDGDIDIVVNNSDDVSFIYRNNTPKNSAYLKIKLKGPSENLFAIGTCVKIFVKDQQQMVERYFSRGLQSAMADDIHFGLGDHKSIDSLLVYWPDGSVQKMGKTKAGQTITIEYGNNKLRMVSGNKAIAPKLFEDISGKIGLSFKHRENDYNDFIKESLMPHIMSRLGPGVASGDVNGDGLDDFFIGGAAGQSGQLFIQNTNNTFKKVSVPAFNRDKAQEDTGALFFDADGDGDLDLYVVSGGNEKAPDNIFYQDRIYENDNGNFKKIDNALPEVRSSGLRVAAGDFDNDGDLDLFVGSRVLPQHYGKKSKSFLLENISDNGKILFADITQKIIPEMVSHTMITDVVWKDFDQDGNVDLIVANEWGPIEVFKNEKVSFDNITKKLDLADQVGWWSSLAVEDIDHDGDLDIIGGNLGLNYKYQASKTGPFHMYLDDFDNNGTDDIVLGYFQEEKVYPVRGRQCSSEQMGFIKEKFPTYNDYGDKNLAQVYGDKLNEAEHYAATNFATTLFINENNEYFTPKPFDNYVQTSSVNKIFIDDFDHDGKDDILMVGNLYGSEIETPRNDAGYGYFLKGNGKGNFKWISNNLTGLWAEGDIKDACMIYLGDKKLNQKIIVMGRNDQNMLSLKNLD